MGDLSNPVHAGDSGRAGEILQSRGGWNWSEPRYGEHFRRCDYCGSVNPEDLVAIPEWEAEWADMKYGWPHKFYVTLQPLAENSALIVSRASIHGGPGTDDLADGYVRAKDLTDKQIEILSHDGHGSIEDLQVEREHDATGELFHAYHFDRQRDHPIHVKFYTEHLQDPNLSDEVKDAIQKRSGLVFEWLSGGRVIWHPYDG